MRVRVRVGIGAKHAFLTLCYLQLLHALSRRPRSTHLQIVKKHQQQLKTKEEQVLAFQEKYNIRIKVCMCDISGGEGSSHPGVYA
jgi:hypothetical protein